MVKVGFFPPSNKLFPLLRIRVINGPRLMTQNLFAKFLFQASGEEDSNGPNQNVCYDVSKLVDFPGFNVSAPPNVRDVSVQWCWVTFILFLCLFSAI